MARVILGSFVAAIAMLILGFIFFGPLGLSGLATGTVADPQAAEIQRTLAADLPNTGTFVVPAPESSAAQTVMYGQGPIATIHYNAGGFAAMDTSVLLKGLIFNFLIALTIGAALLGINGRVSDFGSRARVAIIIALAGAGYTHLGEPIYLHHDWPHFIYLFIADGLALAAAGLIVARFLPRPSAAAAPAEAPTEV